MAFSFIWCLTWTFYTVSVHIALLLLFDNFDHLRLGVRITEEEKCFIDTYVNLYCNENENMQIKDMVT